MADGAPSMPLIGEADGEVSDEEERATSDALNTLRRARDTESLGPGDLAALVRASADGIPVLDNDHRVVYANPAACELLGYPPDRMLDLDVLKLIPERERQTALTVLANARRSQSQAVTGTLLGLTEPRRGAWVSPCGPAAGSWHATGECWLAPARSGRGAARCSPCWPWRAGGGAGGQLARDDLRLPDLPSRHPGRPP